MAHVPDISPDGQHEKERTQHVLAFGHPSHRFGPQGMDGKHRGHKRAAPQAPGHLPQHQKQQHRRGGVQQDIDQMVSPSVQPEELAVQHVGKCGEWNPVGDLHMGEGITNPLQS